MYPPPMPSRSVIPRVVGIIALPFACVGLVTSLVWTFGPLHDINRWGVSERLGGITTWLYAWLAISVLLFGVHLVGGILAILYKPAGLRVLTGYAVGALALIAIDLVMMHGFMPRIPDHDVHSSVTMARTVFDGLAAPWPVIVLALVSSRGARAACS
jgi:hypothetical protein